MAQAVQEPPKTETSSGQTRNTGFHEPLSEDRNTTLPHPDADTSPSATLEGADIPLSRTNSRILPRLHHRSRSSVHKAGHHLPSSSSKNACKEQVNLVMDPSQMYKGIEYADGTKEKDGGNSVEVPRDSGVDLGRGKNDGESSGSEEDGEGGRRKKRGLRARLGLK